MISWKCNVDMDWYEFVCKLIQHSGPFRGSYITSHRHITLHSNGLFAMHCIGLICTICTSCISQKMWIISHNAAVMNALHFVCSVQCSGLWRDEYCTVQHIAHPFPWGWGGEGGGGGGGWYSEVSAVAIRGESIGHQRLQRLILPLSSTVSSRCH